MRPFQNIVSEKKNIFHMRPFSGWSRMASTMSGKMWTSFESQFMFKHILINWINWINNKVFFGSYKPKFQKDIIGSFDMNVCLSCCVSPFLSECPGRQITIVNVINFGSKEQSAYD